MQVAALVFDFDGLILDTEEPEFVSVTAEFARHGVHVTLDEWRDTVGSADHQHWLDWLDERFDGELDRDVVSERRRAHHHELIAQKEVLPGVADLLESAHAAGLGIAAASSSDRWWVEGHLDRLGLIGYFDAVRSGDEVEFTKPAPELFLLALESLGVASSQAIAFEDSHHGTTAAKAAGIFTVAVPNTITRQSSFDHADLVLNSLADFDLDRHLPSP